MRGKKITFVKSAWNNLFKYMEHVGSRLPEMQCSIRNECRWNMSIYVIVIELLPATLIINGAEDAARLTLASIIYHLWMWSCGEKCWPFIILPSWMMNFIIMLVACRREFGNRMVHCNSMGSWWAECAGEPPNPWSGHHEDQVMLNSQP